MVGQGGTRRRPSLPVPVCRPHTPMMMMMMVTTDQDDDLDGVEDDADADDVVSTEDEYIILKS